jgi:hypothetical protein
MAKKKKKHKDHSGMLIPAGLFVGLGIGLITGQVAGYLLIGLGVGFLASALANMKKK